MNWKPAIEKPEAYKTVLLALVGENNKYTTGWYAAPVNKWIGLAMNQSPPVYELEAGSVEYWCEIDAPVMPPKESETMETQQMAQALIDLHNCLPYSSEDKYNEMSEDAEPFEYVQDLYENLLVELWEIANRFPPNSLEAVLSAEPGLATVALTGAQANEGERTNDQS